VGRQGMFSICPGARNEGLKLAPPLSLSQILEKTSVKRDLFNGEWS